MLCLALTALAVGPTAAQGWENFSPADAGFSVSMPGKPTASNQEVPTASGQIINHLYMLQLEQSVYIVTYADFPRPTSDPAMIKAMLDRARDSATKATGGELKDEKEIKLDGNPGREWFVRFPSSLARARAYWVRNQRLYQAIVMMPEGKDADAERAREAMMAKFLDSFALKSAAAGR